MTLPRVMFVIAKKIILAYRSMFLLISPALSSIRWFTLTTFMVLAFSSASRLGQFHPSFQDSSFLDKRFPVLHSSLSFEMTLPRVMFVITKLYWPFRVLVVLVAFLALQPLFLFCYCRVSYDFCPYRRSVFKDVEVLQLAFL
jgi:hypothetical protein